MTAPAYSLPASPISLSLADFATGLRLEDVPEAALHAAKYHLLDTIGVAFAAASLPELHALAKALAEFTPGKRRVPGIRSELSERDAALIFGMLIHGIEFDDTSVKGRLHPSGSCAPPALILGASRDASGADVLRAYIIGVEAAIRLGAVARGGISEAGFDPTGVIGTLASAILSSALMGSGRDQVVRAIAMACSLASGNMEYLSELTFTKRLHAGNAGSSGITAALLGRTVIPVPSNPLSGRQGLYPLYTKGATNSPDYNLATEGLGKEWLIASELAYKPMPLCFFSIPAADCAIDLRNEESINPAQIERIIVHIPKAAFSTIAEPEAPRRRPDHRYAAQFSVYYAVASALARGEVSLADFTTEALNDPTVLALIDKSTCVEDQGGSFPRYYSAAVEIILSDGRQLMRRHNVHRGSSASGYGERDIEEKFLGNVTLSHGDKVAKALRDLILTLEDLPDLSPLEALFSAC